ncbi:Hypothetical predicted protein [Octopus vulgaris]|uniref:Reverse transcriptase domain-containing protein n=1 Tax=Octopus vulgaris TaxID=6645 RepID=A0AA36AFV8_OCTVU|nr:Hypothetical predicted protein [Octopus vulgaris]
MFLETKRKTKSVYQIACPMVNLEARPPGKSQPGIEKSSTGTNSSPNTDMDGHLNGKSPNSSPPSSPPQPPQKEKCKRNKWTREEYKEVIYAYYYALGRPSQERHTANSYSIWRTRNQDSRPYLDENKLANVRRDILRNNRLTDSEISAIKHATENDINIRHKGNEESDEQYSPPRGLIERLPPDQSTQRPEDTRNSIVPVKDSQENEKTTVTEDLAFAEERRESMAEMRQKILNTLEVVRHTNEVKEIAKKSCTAENAKENNFYFAHPEKNYFIQCDQWVIKCLEEMGTPLHLVQLIRSLYQNQEATVRTSYCDTDWFEIGKGTRQGCILSPAAFNMCAEKVMRNAGLEDSSIGVRIGGRNINNLRYADDTTLLAESGKDLEDLVLLIKKESERFGLYLNVKKTKIMSTTATTNISIKIDNEEIDVVDDFIIPWLQNKSRW